MIMKMQAELWEKLPDGAVRCDLCFRHCRIGLGEKGFCAVRVNEDGRLLTLVGDSVVSISLDPVEKKPLYHFLPSTPTLSIGTLGCNFACLFCQNYSISRRPADTGRYDGIQEINPQELVSYAVEHSVPSISFTYNEPTVFYELLCRTADLALPAGIRTVMVTNGCMSRACLNELGPRVTAANVDLKAFREDSYAKVCSGSLSAVKRNLVLMKEKGWWVEVTTLVVPGMNDSDGEVRIHPGTFPHFSPATVCRTEGRRRPPRFSARGRLALPKACTTYTRAMSVTMRERRRSVPCAERLW